jgi:recombination protein RecA
VKDSILLKLKRLNDKQEIIKLAKEKRIHERIPTGSLSLDYAIDGGWPLGRIVTLWGPKGSTKSTLALHTIKNAQKMGKQCLYIDAERTFDASWAEAIGVDVDELLVYEEVDSDKIIEKMKEEDFFSDIDICVIDSVSVVYSEQVLRDNSAAVGLQARATKRIINMLPYFNPNALILVISQMTMVSAGPMMFRAGWTGGNALDHHSSLIIGLSVRKDERIERPENGIKTVVGQTVRWRVDKTKISQPLLEGQYDFLYSGAIDSRYELVELAIRRGIIEAKGNWLTYKENKVNGIRNLVDLLEDAEMYKGLYDEIFDSKQG